MLVRGLEGMVSVIFFLDTLGFLNLNRLWDSIGLLMKFTFSVSQFLLNYWPGLADSLFELAHNLEER